MEVNCLSVIVYDTGEGSMSSHSWHSVLRLRTRLSLRPNNNNCKPHIGRKIVCNIKWCVVIFFPQSYSKSQTELYDDRSAFCREQWVSTAKNRLPSNSITNS